MKFLPECRAITAFGDGGFRFGDHSHRGSLLIVPSGMYPWDEQDVALIIAEQAEIDFIVLGQGRTFKAANSLPSRVLQQADLMFDSMSTSAAVRTYNLMFGEARRVAACLIAVQ